MNPPPERRHRPHGMTPAEAEHHSRIHLVDRFDSDQLALLGAACDPAAPLVIPRNTARVCTTEITRRGRFTGLRITGERGHHAAREVATFLERDLLDAERQVQVNDDGEPRTAHILALTQRGRHLLQVAREIGRTP